MKITQDRYIEIPRSSDQNFNFSEIPLSGYSDDKEKNKAQLLKFGMCVWHKASSSSWYFDISYIGHYKRTSEEIIKMELLVNGCPGLGTEKCHPASEVNVEIEKRNPQESR